MLLRLISRFIQSINDWQLAYLCLIESILHLLAGIVSQSLDNWDMDELGGEEKSAVDGFLDRLAHASKAQQITTGGVSGWFVICRLTVLTATLPLVAQYSSDDMNKSFLA